MIVLIVGDFCVGKDLVADLMIEKSLEDNNCEKTSKIRSYTTRKPRYEGERTHLFCSKEEFLSLNDFVAQTQVGDHFYGARRSQFDTKRINLYCVDVKGVMDILEAAIDKVFIVEVVRPVWLKDCPKERINRKTIKNDNFKYIVDYRIINDGTKEKLKQEVASCFDMIIKEKKKHDRISRQPGV